MTEDEAASGVHATAVVYGEYGVLIVGPSGAGKSALALALLSLADCRGFFAALVGDDRVYLQNRSGRLVASGATHMSGLIERRFAGLTVVKSEPAVVVRVVADLSGRGKSWPRWPQAEAETCLLADVRIPRLALDSGAAVDQAAAVDQWLKFAKSAQMAGKRISLEQFAALHKNEGLTTRHNQNDA